MKYWIGVLVLSWGFLSHAKLPDVDFNVSWKALQAWYELTDGRNVSNIEINSQLYQAFPIALDSFFQQQKKWSLAKRRVYGSRPFTSYLNLQIHQAPYRAKSLVTNGTYWIYQTDDHSKRLFFHARESSIGDSGIQIAYKNDDAKHLSLMNEFIRDIQNYIFQHSPYRGAVLEYKSRLAFFWQGIDDLKVDWPSFIFKEKAKSDLRRTIDFFLDEYGSDAWTRYKLPDSRGVLLYGPPGTGKSFIAKVIASRVMQKKYKNRVTYLHVQARHLERLRDVRGLYNLARNLAPSVVFIEDIDLIAGTHRNDRAELKNELMQQLSGVEELKGVITIATTNLPEKLDPAIKRRKRLGFHHHIGLPGFVERGKLFKLFMSKTQYLTVDIEKIVARTEGESGATIKEIVDQAMQLALDENSVDNENKQIVLKQEHLDNVLKLKKL